VIALFFGVAFLLRYLAEIITVPIELKLVGVAVAGGALVLLGARLARGRPGYGLSLEGAGAGILYLTTFAAFRLYDVLPAFPAFVLLVLAFRLARHSRKYKDPQAVENKVPSTFSAKSILGVLTLAASRDTPLVLEVEGPDEVDAVEKIVALILGKFGED